MKKAAIRILYLSVVITAFFFVHDYLYDKPSQPYTLGQQMGEIIVVGSIYTGILFVLLFASWLLIRQVAQRLR